jgi:hypothetical protein
MFSPGQLPATNATATDHTVSGVNEERHITGSYSSRRCAAPPAPIGSRFSPSGWSADARLDTHGVTSFGQDSGMHNKCPSSTHLSRSSNKEPPPVFGHAEPAMAATILR